LQRIFAKRIYSGDFDFLITAPANQGAVVTVTP
jgi:hypothetical protein